MRRISYQKMEGIVRACVEVRCESNAQDAQSMLDRIDMAKLWEDCQDVHNESQLIRVLANAIAQTEAV